MLCFVLINNEIIRYQISVIGALCGRVDRCDTREYDVHVRRTLYVHCTSYNVHCTPYSVRYMLCNVCLQTLCVYTCAWSAPGAKIPF